MRFLCMLGRHHGSWSLPGGGCERTRICDACGRRQQQTRHTWSDFRYTEPAHCEQQRRCERCGTTQQRSWHQWGPWLYAENEFNSRQVHTCRRCNLSELSSHTYR